MIRWRRGTVRAVGRSWPGSVELDVTLEGGAPGEHATGVIRALAHPPLVGDPVVGDVVERAPDLHSPSVPGAGGPGAAGVVTTRCHTPPLASRA